MTAAEFYDLAKRHVAVKLQGAGDQTLDGRLVLVGRQLVAASVWGEVARSAHVALIVRPEYGAVGMRAKDSLLKSGYTSVELFEGDGWEWNRG